MVGKIIIRGGEEYTTQFPPNSSIYKKLLFLNQREREKRGIS